MSQIASRAASLMAAPLSPAVATAPSLPTASLLVGTSPADAAPAALPAAAATTSRGSSVPATAGTVVRADATATVAGEPAASTAPPAASTSTSNPAAAGATAAPGAAFTKPAATAFTQPPTTTTHVGTPTAFPNPPSAAGGIGGAVTALTVVIALILALAWLAKRMPVLGGGAGSNPSLRIVGSLALGPRERVVVIAVGDTQLLLGVGASGTRILHTLDEPLPVAASTTTPVFAQLLAQHFGKKA